MWQKCPICNGTGKTTSSISSSGSYICSTCGGKKIISQLTGLPPISAQVIPPTHTLNLSDFRDFGYETQQEYFGK